MAKSSTVEIVFCIKTVEFPKNYTLFPCPERKQQAFCRDGSKASVIEAFRI